MLSTDGGARKDDETNGGDEDASFSDDDVNILEVLEGFEYWDDEKVVLLLSHLTKEAQKELDGELAYELTKPVFRLWEEGKLNRVETLELESLLEYIQRTIQDEEVQSIINQLERGEMDEDTAIEKLQEHVFGE
jgi:hypothetical protein